MSDLAGYDEIKARHTGRQSGDDDSPLALTIASTLAGTRPPDRPWCVSEWIPRQQVTLLTGDGGTGKSLLALQLMIAATSSTRWLGLSVMPCKALGIFAEDDEGELHRRMKAVADAGQIEVGRLSDMAWRSAVVDACELIELDAAGQVQPTIYYRRLESAVRDFGARLVVLDAATNLYGGDEIKRRQVNGFLTMLRRLALDIDGAVLLLAHPSAAGISTGTGLSGSTHWNNAVRSRLYFVRSTGDDADPDERWLSRPKANYTGAGDTLRVRWTDGAFVPLDEPTGIDRAAISAKAERIFLSLLAQSYSVGTWTCPNPAARNYAPSIFGKHPDREGLGKPAFETAMHRLMKTCQIKIETYGRPSEPRSRLALA